MTDSHKPRKPSAASAMIGLGGQRIDRTALKNRFAERDARQLADNRTEAQRWLGDPPASRSALACKNNTLIVRR
jgi:hypothetical protein